MTIKEFTAEGNQIPINANLVKLFGGDVTTALVFRQLFYWFDKTGKEWIYKSYTEWEQETGLSQYKVKRATDKMIQLGILHKELRRAGGAPTLHYNLDYQEALLLITLIINNLHNQEPSLSSNSIMDNQEPSQSIIKNLHNGLSRNSINMNKRLPQEITKKNTQEITKTRKRAAKISPEQKAEVDKFYNHVKEQSHSMPTGEDYRNFKTTLKKMNWDSAYVIAIWDFVHNDSYIAHQCASGTFCKNIIGLQGKYETSIEKSKGSTSFDTMIKAQKADEAQDRNVIDSDKVDY